MNIERMQVRCRWLALWAILVSQLPTAHLAGADAWSPGVTDETWGRIHRLQSVSQPASARSPFVQASLASPYPIERAAAVGWIARTASVAHLEDLEKCLSDKSPEVRRLAWTALQLLPDERAARKLLQLLETQPDLPGDKHMAMGPYEVQLPSHTSLAKRKAWLAQLGDREAWIRSFVKVRAGLRPGAVELKSCVVDTSGTITWKIGGMSPGQPIRVIISKPLLEWSAAEGPLGDYPGQQTGLRGVTAFSVADGVQVNFSKMKDLSPGVYRVHLTAEVPMGMGVRHDDLQHMPFFVRINRTNAQEQEVQQLLERPLDEATVKRLRTLRSQDAVPKLIERFHATTDCEQAAVGRALAMTSDPRAVSTLLGKTHLSCIDSGWICTDELVQLDTATRQVCSEKLSEMCSQLSQAWESLSEQERWDKLEVIRLVLLNCERPLSERQTQVGMQLIAQLKEDARHTSNRYAHQSMAPFLVAYLGSDPQLVTAWLQANQDEPELVLSFLRELTWPARKDATRFEYTAGYWQAIVEQLAEWKSSPKLTKDQLARLERAMAEVQGEIDDPRSR